jgi:uncharacterized protein (DUF488 family)
MKGRVVAGRSVRLQRLGTIGVYGFDEATFHARLREFGADLLVDVRRRRGVRGAAGAFANATRLQRDLAERGVAYAHLLELAPTEGMRDLQRRADVAAGVGSHDRERLDPAYAKAYCASLDGDVLARVVEALGDAGAPVLLCVEEDASACHRSRAAAWLAERLSLAGVTHLAPAG